MNEKQLEDALRAWPLTEVPTGFSKHVMARIEHRQSSVRISQDIKLKFRLSWMDFALGCLLSMLPVLVFIAYISLPRKFVLYLKYQWLVLQYPAYETVLFAVIGGIVMLVLLVFILSLRYTFPRQVPWF